MNLLETARKMPVGNTALLRAVWLLIAAGMVALVVVAVPLRYQMLLSDFYGYAGGLQELGLTLPFFAAYFVSWELLVAACSLGVAALVAWKRGRDRFAMLVAFTLALIGLMPPLVDGISYVYPQLTVPIALLRLAELVALMAVFCLFPNGRFAPGWMRWLLIAYLLFSLLIAVVQPGVLADSAVLPTMRTLGDAVWLFVGGSWFIVAIAGQIVRYRRYSNSAEKQQTKWVLFGFTIVVIFSVFSPLLLAIFPQLNNAPDGRTLFTLLVGVLFLLSLLTLPTTIALAILRYRLWDVDLFLNRTLIYVGLTALVTAAYILLVGGAGTLAANRSGRVIGFALATMFLVVGIRPLRRRWQTAVDRFFPVPDPQQYQRTAEDEPRPASKEEESTASLHGAKQWLIWLSLLLAILVAAGMSVTAANRGLPPGQWLFYLIIPAFVGVGTLIVLRRPANRIGRLCLLIGWLFVPVQVGSNYGAVLGDLVQSEALRTILVRLSLTLAQVMVVLIFVYLPLLFPDGQFLNRRWRRLAQTYTVLIAVPISLALVKPGPVFDWTADEVNRYTVANPLAVNWPLLDSLHSETLFFAWSLPTLLAVFAAIGSLVLRWRRSEGATRQQVKAVVYFLSSVATIFMLMELAGQLLYRDFLETDVYPAVALITFLGFPLVIGLAVLKYRLYDIDVIINRTLVYGGLSLAIVSIYVLVVGALGTLFQTQGNVLFALLATGLIAALFQPVREKLQTGVNRFMFGERDDPYAVLSKLGRQLQTTARPEAMLQSLVETVADTLKLPYVAIDLADRQGRLGGAATGKAVAETLELPLRYQNETVGYLVVSPRSPGESFTVRERRLLADMAAQTGAMAYSVRVTAALQRSAAALQRSREKLVLTREEERRRIRRDLHDGLGPTLASQTFAIDAILEHLGSDTKEAERLLRGLKAQNQETVAEIRRLVYELRPPALDELGLMGALQAHMAQLTDRYALQIRITFHPDPLPRLSAAVDVAAYRITLEAMTNVVRHAQAEQCDVSVKIVENDRPHLQLDVVDDGVGLPPALHPGVGFSSMRERAEELGGSLAVVNEREGTRVTAVLPLAPFRGAE